MFFGKLDTFKGGFFLFKADRGKVKAVSHKDMFMIARFSIGVILALSFNASVYATSQTHCEVQKYQAYQAAVKNWYQHLTNSVVKNNPSLAPHGQAFLSQQAQLQALNLAALRWQHSENSADPHQGSVESWVNLTQAQIHEYAQPTHPLYEDAHPVYQNRQSQHSGEQYPLRKAFALLLSQPNQLQSELETYNRAIERINITACEKNVKLSSDG